jgi:hypothetical protein
MNTISNDKLDYINDTLKKINDLILIINNNNTKIQNIDKKLQNINSLLTSTTNNANQSHSKNLYDKYAYLHRKLHLQKEISQKKQTIQTLYEQYLSKFSTQTGGQIKQRNKLIGAFKTIQKKKYI